MAEIPRRTEPMDMFEAGTPVKQTLDEQPEETFAQAFSRARRERMAGKGDDVFKYKGKEFIAYTQDDLNMLNSIDYDKLKGRFNWIKQDSKPTQNTSKPESNQTAPQWIAPDSMKPKGLVDTTGMMDQVRKNEVGAEMISPHKYNMQDSATSISPEEFDNYKDGMVERAKGNPELTDQLQEIIVRDVAGGVLSALTGQALIKYLGSFLPKASNAVGAFNPYIKEATRGGLAKGMKGLGFEKGIDDIGMYAKEYLDDLARLGL